MDATAQESVDAFLRHLTVERRFSMHTTNGYGRDLAALAAWCDQQDIAAWKALKHADVRRFSAHSHATGLGPRSIRRRLSAIRSFYAYLLGTGRVRHNPAVDVRAPKAQKRLPHTLDPDQMGHLLERRTDALLDQRDVAMMELLYSSGLRLAELLSLNLTGLHLTDRTVRVTGKGNKERIVPMGRKAVTALNEWIADGRAQLARPDETALFVGRNGRRLGARSVQQRLATHGRRLGLPMRIHPHLFRHSFATHLLESSQDLRGVQELLGHADISTTQIYTHLDFQHLARIYDVTHPRARRK
jgi:integrase/recombinase XerC